ncbi:hypothetical protein CWI38_0635p0030, partial [Hamiltosporidium tvaerminnensis]
EAIGISEKNSAISNGLSGFRKYIFRDFKFPFDSERSSTLGILNREKSIIFFNNEFPDYIFPDKNIFPSDPVIPDFGTLNKFKRANISIILESEYLIIIFIKDYIEKFGEECFYLNFSLENIFNENSENRKILNNVFSSIQKIEPINSEISENLYITLSHITVDVHIAFAFYKLDTRLFSFVQNEILSVINSSDLKEKVKEKIFIHPDIYYVFFDLYKLCFKKATIKYKALRQIKDISFMDLSDYANIYYNLYNFYYEFVNCGKSGKTVDHLATRCEKMLGYDYTRRHNEVVRCLHLLLLNRYKFKSLKRIRSHSVQEIFDNEYAELRVDTRIKTDVKIRNNRPDIFILDKKKNKITLIEVGITCQDSLQIVETKKLRKYDLLANDLIISYVMTWDGIVTKYHKSHLKRLEIPMNVEAYIQSIVIKKTVETISFDRRRELESGLNAEESWKSEMHEEPTPPLKEEKREEDGVKTLKPKNNTPLISQGGTTLEEPTNNINEESDLEEETKVVKEVDENI